MEKTKGLDFLRNVSIAGATTILGLVLWFVVTVKELFAGAPVWLETPSIQNGSEKNMDILAVTQTI